MSYAHKALRILFSFVVFANGGAVTAQTVAITEYMNDTNGVAAGGEWVELYNYGTTAVTLNNWRLRDDDSDSALIPTVTIEPKNFVVLARTKSIFEQMWLGGVADPRVLQISGHAMSDGGPDELVLRDENSAIVWRLAYGDYPASNSGASTYYASTDFSITNHGTKSSVISRNGNDALTGQLGYEGNEFTPDPLAYSGAGDVGSPLRGGYPGAVNGGSQQTAFTLDVSGEGIVLHSGVRGIALADQALDRGDNSDQTAIIPSAERAVGSAIRGVSGGLNADIYDWKTRNAQPRPTTLEFLRMSRDYTAELYVTANVRGLTEPDPDVPGYRRYYTSDTQTLANLAADWVRYTNRIVHLYREGDTITDPRDASILNELTWSSSYVNPFGTADNFTKLLLPGEAAVPKVTYWEIGNEPLISLANAYSVTNAYTFSGTAGNSTHADYVARYIALTTAMLAEDPTIKVGPCLVNGRSGGNANILTALLQSSAQIDFISYHPYGSMGDYLSAGFQQAYLGGVYSEQYLFLADIKNLVALHRPAQAATMEYVASETNVSDFRTNNQFQEACVAHALGSVESVFSWARMGLKAAHYWIWITHVNTQLSDWHRYAVTFAFERLRDRLGDRLLGAFDAHDRVRVYVVKNSSSREICVWALNFSDSEAIPFQLSLTNSPGAAYTRITSEVLGAPSGSTSLFSANLPAELNSGTPRRDVEWSTPLEMTGADPANLSLNLPAATITLVSIEDLSPTAAEDWVLFQ